MIVQIFGATDLVAAGLLYFGKISGPQFLVSACIILLILKGAMSLFPFPFYLPGFLMNITDITTVILLYFGATPIPELKAFIIVVLLVKALPSLISSAFLLLGWITKK
ncbi:MAG: hypothetical protein ABIF85_00160 [Nanoarchaeota archaeon]|nr:hypothetical protein [Nanoarchaeota archaeon]MBU4300058.1 hypothetical protein [Nanoarchaeota archaeon]MBU4451859.1 hypothetical protein [Nanoarchaeota archaeon]MCG2724405.1 hypothetical protein [archaeon]